MFRGTKLRKKKLTLSGCFLRFYCHILRDKGILPLAFSGRSISFEFHIFPMFLDRRFGLGNRGHANNDISA